METKPSNVCQCNCATDNQARYITEHIVRLYDLIAALAHRLTGQEFFVLMGDSEYNRKLWRYNPQVNRVMWFNPLEPEKSQESDFSKPDPTASPSREQDSNP